MSSQTKVNTINVDMQYGFRSVDKKGEMCEYVRSYFLGTSRVPGSSNNINKRDLKIIVLNYLKDYYHAMERGNYCGVVKKAAVPGIILSFFTNEEIERDRDAFIRSLISILPAEYLLTSAGGYSGNSLLYMGGYRPTRGIADTDFWFGAGEKTTKGQEDEDVHEDFPFALYVENSRYGEFSGEAFIPIPGDRQIPNPGIMPEEYEKELWSVLLRGVSVVPEQWLDKAERTALFYASALERRNEIMIESRMLPPIPVFTPPEFLGLALKDGRTVLETISPVEVLGRPLVFDTSGKTLAAKFPGSDRTVFEHWMDNKKEWWELKGLKTPFEAIVLSNYTKNCIHGIGSGKSVYMECINAQSNKFYRMTDNSDGTFTAQWGAIGKNPQSKTYPISDWYSKKSEKEKKGYVERYEYNPRLAEGIDFPKVFQLAKAMSVGVLSMKTTDEYITRTILVEDAERIAKEMARAAVSAVHQGAPRRMDMFYVYRNGFNGNDDTQNLDIHFFQRECVKRFEEMEQKTSLYAPEAIRASLVSLGECFNIMAEGLTPSRRSMEWRDYDNTAELQGSVEERIKRKRDALFMRLGASSSIPVNEGEIMFF